MYVCGVIYEEDMYRANRGEIKSLEIWRGRMIIKGAMIRDLEGCSESGEGKCGRIGNFFSFW